MTKKFIKEFLLEIKNDLDSGNIEKAKTAVNGMLLLVSSIKPTEEDIKWAESVIQKQKSTNTSTDA